MNTITDLSDRQLIDFVYSEVAGQKIRDNVRDLSDIKKWRDTVDSMPIPVRLVYYIGIFNRQVMNGGLIQYFDNGYGVFAYQTLEYLQMAKAISTYNFLNQCLIILNPKEYQGDDFVQYIKDRKYENIQTLSSQLDKLDNQYLTLNDKEDLESLVAKYLRQNIGSIK